MDCGIPFCRYGTVGCPLSNLIPDWNDLVRRDRWDAASERLHAANNSPEFTGRLCPAPCEAACVLSIAEEQTGGSVTIKRIENTIVDQAWRLGLVEPQPAKIGTGKSVALVGSGPAGLAAAQQLTRAGHDVTVYERDDRLGGLLRYGIPEYKLEKATIDPSLAQMRAEGTRFVTDCEVGVDLSVEELRTRFDAVVLAVGARRAEGRAAAHAVDAYLMGGSARAGSPQSGTAGGLSD
jgi:glutamate synthase (NADPH) small chain